MKYKLVVLDLDGTTVRAAYDALPSPKVKEAIREAKNHVHVSIATGRAHANSKHILELLELSGPGIVNGGSEVTDLTTGKLIYSKQIDEQKLRHLAEISQKYDYVAKVRSESNKEEIKGPHHITGPREKFTLYNVDRQELDEVIELLNQVEEIAVHHAQSWTGAHVADIHVTHREGTKQHGLEFVAKHHGVELHEVMVIGNDHNDIPLIKAAGHGIAMGDSPEEVKKLADHVTGTIDEDGVAQAIEKFILS